VLLGEALFYLVYISTLDAGAAASFNAAPNEKRVANGRAGHAIRCHNVLRPPRYFFPSLPLRPQPARAARRREGRRWLFPTDSSACSTLRTSTRRRGCGRALPPSTTTEHLPSRTREGPSWLAGAFTHEPSRAPGGRPCHVWHAIAMWRPDPSRMNHDFAASHP
jgi:hypothetical protein